MKILHVITGLNVGGAELMLCALSARLAEQGYDQKVVSLLAEGPLSARIREAGIECVHIGLNRGTADFRGIRALRREVSEFEPDVIHAWMYHACIYSLASTWFGRHRPPVLWSVHHANLDVAHNSWSTLLAAGLCGSLSYSKRVHIAYCAESSRSAHEIRGFYRHRGTFIPNGYSPDKFFRRPEARDAVAAQFNIPRDVTVVGMVARFDPIKDHATFLKAARLAAEDKSKKIVFVLFGEGMDSSNQALKNLISRNGLAKSVVLAGRWDDMVTAYSALDFLVLSSRGEAFPNVICEGMLCELPCISTDVGDCRAVIGECGFIVPAGSPDALAQAITGAVELPRQARQELGKAARHRIITLYSTDRCLSRYISSYVELADGCA